LYEALLFYWLAGKIYTSPEILATGRIQAGLGEPVSLTMVAGLAVTASRQSFSNNEAAEAIIPRIMRRLGMIGSRAKCFFPGANASEHG